MVELSEDYDEIDLLIDTDPIRLGERCRRAERERDLLAAELTDVKRKVANAARFLDRHFYSDLDVNTRATLRATLAGDGGESVHPGAECEVLPGGGVIHWWASDAAIDGPCLCGEVRRHPSRATSQEESTDE